MQAIHVEQHGGPEVLALTEVDDPTPGPGEALVAVAVAGLNFVDVYQRSGLYPVATPYVPGSEGAGTVEAVGDGVADLVPGDTVAWTSVPGSYAQKVAAPAERLVKVPEGVDARTA